MQVNVNMKSREELTIGELASRFGLATHVLRHWEQAGLLTPAHRVNGRRRYTTDHVTRIAIIVRSKAAGFSLPEIREVLDASDGSTRRALLRTKREELDRRIAQAAAQQAIIDHILECPNADFMHCGTFRRLVADLELQVPVELDSLRGLPSGSST